MIRPGRNIDQGSGVFRLRKPADFLPAQGIATDSSFVLYAFVAATMCAIFPALLPKVALADDLPTLSGSWTATSMSEKWSTSDWGDGCGPKPSAGGAPGGAATVTQTGGELSFSGPGRPFSTTQCWEQLPGMKRTSHSGGQRGWSSTCASPSGDGRRATVVTKMSATDTTIVFSESGSYEFSINDSICKASVSRSRSYKLVQRAGEEPAKTAEPPPPPPPTATAKPDPVPPYEGDCDSNKTPARFEVRPTRKLLRPGESFTVVSAVTDTRGCRLGIAPELTAEANATGGKLSIDKLTITAASDAPAGTANVVATLGGKSLTLVVEVALPEKYDELLKERGLNQAGEDEQAAVAEIAAGFGGATTEAEDTAKDRRITFLVVAVGMAALLGFAGLVLLRRGKRAHERDESDVADAPVPSNVMFFDDDKRALECPKCGRVFAVGEGFCEGDGSALVPSKNAPPAPEPPPPTVAAASVAAPVSKRKAPDKICPSCGDRFPTEAGFCGKDGTQLVPIN